MLGILYIVTSAPDLVVPKILAIEGLDLPARVVPCSWIRTLSPGRPSVKRLYMVANQL